MTLKEAVEQIEEYLFVAAGYPKMEEALETVISTCKKAELTEETLVKPVEVTDEEIRELAPKVALLTDEAGQLFKETWVKGYKVAMERMKR